MKKIITTISIFLLITLALTACSTAPKADATPTVATPIASSTSVAIDLPTMDRADNPITVPKEVKTIITLVPSIAEVLIDLGSGDKIIAADTQSKALQGLPADIPFIDMMQPDIEKIVALKPDVIFASTMSMVGGTDPLKPLKDLGICVIYIPSSDSIAGIYDDIMFISSVVQANEQGQVIVDNMKTKIEAIQKTAATITAKKSVYFEIAAAPDLYSFGKGVFLNEMLELIGAKNIFADQASWISVAEENILAANPDVIITNVNYIDNPVAEILARKGWENITAVKNKNVYYVDNISSSLPNHHIIAALEQMAKAVYPDKF